MTNDGMLSQDEIDALLNIGSDEAEEVSTDSAEELTNLEEDTLGEIGNISFGSSATTLSTLLNQKVEITTPTVCIMDKNKLIEKFEDDHISVEVNYIEGFIGTNVFMIKVQDAAIISDIMLGGDGSAPSMDLNEIHLSAVQEAMNQMMGAAATSMSTIFNKRVDISPPNILSKEIEEEFFQKQFADEHTYVKVSFHLKVGELIDSNIMQIMPLEFAKEQANQLLRLSEEEVSSTIVVEEIEPMEQTNMYHENQVKQAPVHEEPQYIGNPVDKHHAVIQEAAFSDLTQAELNNSEKRNLDMLLDIPLKVTVELGRTNRTIKDILNLTSGSIVELDKLAGEPIDILVNEKLIAKGEVVVIDENFGVRVTDIVSQIDRLKNLK